MRKFAIVLMVLGAGCSLAGVAMYVAAGTGQELAREEWVAEPAGAAGDSPAVEFTRLSFPALSREFYVENRATRSTLLRGPAHVTGSVFPGERGNCIIAAHRDTHFRILKDIQVNDRVVLEHNSHKYTYSVVTLKVIRARDRRYYRPTAGPVLTLVTCYPFYFVGRAPDRFIVRAALVTDLH